MTNLQDFIDSRTLSRHQVSVIGLCSAIVFMDGFDTQSIGYVAPAVMQSLGVGRSALGPVFSAGLFGLMLGALIFGPVADRVGRKPVLVACTLWFGVLSLFTANADSLPALLALRFLTGLGLGGAMPNAVALTNEYTPKRLRATAVMVMFSGFSLGAALGGLIAAVFIERFGWPSVFIFGGIAPCLLSVLVLIFLPESIRHLALQPGRERQLVDVLRRIDPTARFDHGTVFAVEETLHRGFTVRQLFTAGRAKLTLLLWLVFFMSLLDLYFMSSWLPTLINDLGVPLSLAVLITAMYQIGGTVGTWTLGRILDRGRPFRSLALTYLAASGFVVAVGVAGAAPVLLFLTVFGAGFCVVGAQTGANALTANAYPTPIRATAIGWALGIGRIGSIVGPSLAGWLISQQWEIQQLFSFAAVPVLIGSFATMVIHRQHLTAHSAQGSQDAASPAPAAP